MSPISSSGIFQISVVIPAKNRAGTIARCIESVLSQSRQVAEIVVADDGSTDDTADIAMSYPTVHLIRNSNSPGAQGARNAGVANSNCPWVAFLDSDDVWEPEKMEHQLAALEASQDPMRTLVHCDGVVEIPGRAEKRQIEIPETSGDAYGDMLLRSGPMFQGIVVYKDRILDIGLLDENCPSYQEWDTAIRLARITRLVHVHIPLFRWCRHEGDTISKNVVRDFHGYQYVIDKHAAEVIRVHGERVYRSLRARLLAHGLKLGCFDEVISLAPDRRLNLAFPLAHLFARTAMKGATVSSLLRLASIP